MQDIIICPVCGQSIKNYNSQYICSNGHGFDLSSTGYLNLLQVNQKSSKNPGDTEVMVKARRLFLEQGFYDFVVDELSEIISKNIELPTQERINILDIGCGEGYYINKLCSTLPSGPTQIQAYGLDITKYAIQLASKKYKNTFFLVSNINYKIPILADSIDIALNIFAPRNPPEFFRILKKNGLLIVVFPGTEHLSSLRKLLDYETSYSEKPEIISASFQEYFEVKEISEIRSTTKLTTDNAALLAQMTPIFWQIDQSKISELPDIEREIFDFKIMVLEKQ